MGTLVVTEALAPFGAPFESTWVTGESVVSGVLVDTIDTPFKCSGAVAAVVVTEVLAIFGTPIEFT